MRMAITIVLIFLCWLLVSDGMNEWFLAIMATIGVVCLYVDYHKNES